ncbi:peptide-methionine (R)-S-oxide reductase MsrB [Polaromonas sp.]|uniref:peptide-methionine (R)-S-oxide reductase MsrB n=1 Tax=Polaromonas sp. TaxID=1869339 RepID=UPI0032642A9F
MKSRRNVLRNGLSSLGIFSAAVAGMRGLLTGTAAHAARTYELMHTDAEWKKLLQPEPYRILRKAGTERPYSSPLNKEKRIGVYSCAGCALPLFSSGTKFESGTGWPSFWQPLDNAVAEETDTTLFIRRTEVLCRRCGGHLGHVFKDGPKPTGLRYCMNGAALTFKEA